MLKYPRLYGSFPFSIFFLILLLSFDAVSFCQFKQFREISYFNWCMLFAVNSEINSIDTKESNVADDNKLMRMWEKNANVFVLRAYAAGVFVDARTRFTSPGQIHSSFWFYHLWNSSHWAKAKINRTPPSVPTLTHAKCEHELVRVWVCIMRKVYLKQKTYYDLILYFIIKSNFVPTPPPPLLHFNENFLCDVLYFAWCAKFFAQNLL